MRISPLVLSVLCCSFLFLMSAPVWADCSSPVAAESAMTWDSAGKQYKYCDGTVWQFIEPASGGSSGCYVTTPRVFNVNVNSGSVDGGNMQDGASCFVGFNDEGTFSCGAGAAASAISFNDGGGKGFVGVCRVCCK